MLRRILPAPSVVVGLAAAAARFQATAASAGAVERKPMSYEKRLNELLADPECPLSQLEYRVLLEKLAIYQDLQGEYAVKQSDIERTKRVANFCGLDFPEPRRRSASEMTPQK
mmetsp:Transcript_76505/g.88942  ORF Transcript_76505/g.88942 Transcript_76505/m.88942 type:complete len:113 (+) Transcript_76505:74-412(+)